MRLENGFGSISKMSGNRRKPYWLRVTTGYELDEKTGKKIQIQETVGFSKTIKDGKKILIDYHRKGKFDRYITFKEVFEIFKKDRFVELSYSMCSAYSLAFNYCEELHECLFGEIDLEDMQEVIDMSNKNYPILRKIKLLLTQMYDIAIMHGKCTTNIARGINIKKYKNRNPNSLNRDKIRSSDLEILWSKRSKKYYQIILFLIYTGVRITEMLNLKKSNVNLKDHYFDVIVSKTTSGIRRVPIADKIYPYVVEWYLDNRNSEYLFTTLEGKHFLYRNYYDSYFTPLMEENNMSYTPHFCRHTCISLMNSKNINKTIIKKIVGHKHAMSMTEKVYTHFEVKEMLNAINSI